MDERQQKQQALKSAPATDSKIQSLNSGDNNTGIKLKRPNTGSNKDKVPQSPEIL